MFTLLGIIALSALSILAMNLRRTYGQTPLKELKRKANKGDQAAQGLYLVAHHGLGADILLLGLSIILGTFSIVLASQFLDTFWGIVYVGGFIILLSTPLHSLKYSPARPIAQSISPYISRFLISIRPIVKRVGQYIKKHRPVTIHTGLYEKEDLVELIEKQKMAANNRINHAELDIAINALSFGDRKVADFMTPRRVIRFVGRDEPVGPVLMGELHDSGFSRFPVTGANENEIVGTLYLKNLVERTKPGIVGNIMSPKVYYVSDVAPLEQVLDAFIKTKHHLFIVVNEFEEIVGLITIEDVIEQILGRKIVDEFDTYEDLRAVAALHAKADHTKHITDKVVE
jgi:CBS domain containing-hemolysin-like protein